MTTPNLIQVRLNFSAGSTAPIRAAVAQVNASMAQLSKIHTALMQSTGRALPAVEQQITALAALAKGGNQVAASMMKARQEGGAFYQVFSGNVKQNLTALFRSKQTAAATIGTLKNELSHLSLVTNTTTGSIKTLADESALRFRIMGRVGAENLNRVATQITTLGKQMQWLGRQMMVGVTLPFIGITALLGKEAVDVTKSQVELTKYLKDTGKAASGYAKILDGTLGKAFEDLSIKTGTAITDTYNLAATWAAAGFTADRPLKALTTLTEQIVALTQGDVNATQSLELVRMIMATFGTTAFTTAGKVKIATETIKQLQLIQSTTSLQMQDIVAAFPLVASGARQLGFTAVQTAALLAGLRQQGVQAATAANTLKYGFSHFAAPSTKAVTFFQDLKLPDLSTFLFDAKGLPKGIKGLEEFAATLQKMTVKQREQAVTLVFGSRQAFRWLQLLQSMTTQGSDYNKALDEGANKQKADIYWKKQLKDVLNNLSKTWERFKVQIQIFASDLGKSVLPMLQNAVEHFVNLLHAITNLPDGFKKAIVGAGAFAASMGPVIYVLSMLRLIQGNVLKAPAMLGRSIFGVSGAENPLLMRTLGMNAKTPANAATAVLAGMPFNAVSSKFDTAGLTALATSIMASEGKTGAQAFTKAMSMTVGRELTSTEFTSTLKSVIEQGYGPQNVEMASGMRGTRFRFADTKKLLSSTQVATMMGIEAPAVIAAGKQVGTDLAESAALQTEQVAKKQGIASKLFGGMEKLFGSKKVNILTPGGQMGGFAAVTLQLTSILPRLIALAAAGLLIFKNWKTIWAGMSEGITTALTTLKTAFSGFIHTLGEAIGLGKKATDTAIWKAFGESVGNIAKALANIISFLLGAIGPFLSAIIKGAQVAVQMIMALAVAITNPIKGLKQLWKAFTGLGIVAAIIGTITAALVIGYAAWKAWGFIAALVSTIQLRAEALRLTLQASTGVIGGVKAAFIRLTTEMEGASLAAPFLALLGIVAAAAIAIYSLFHKTNEGAQHAQEAIDSLSDSFTTFISDSKDMSKIGFASAAKDIVVTLSDQVGKLHDAFVETGKWSSVTDELKQAYKATSPILQTLNDLTVSQLRTMKQLTQEAYKQGTSKLRLTLATDKGQMASSLRDAYAEFKTAVKTQDMRDGGVGIGGNIRPTLESTMPTFSAFVKMIHEMDKGVKDTGFDFQVFGGIAKDSLNKTPFEKWRDKLGSIQFQIKYLSRYLVPELSNTIQDKLLTSAMAAGGKWTTMLDSARRVIQTKFGDLGQKAGKAFNDGFQKALPSMLDRLMGRVTDAIMAKLDEKQQAQTDAFDKGQQAQVDAFDKATDKKAADIQRQIDAINKQNDAEAKLQRDRQYRQQLEDLLNQAGLKGAIAYRERLKAIHEGRFDDAKLISLQLIADEQDLHKQQTDLQKQHNQDAANDDKQKKIDALQKELDHWNKVRDAQKQALQARLDADKQAFQKQLDMQKTLLQNQLDDLTQFGSKTTAQWKKTFDDVVALAGGFGENLNGITDQFMQQYGTTIKDGLHNAIQDAKTQAHRDAQDLGKTVGDGVASGTGASAAFALLDKINSAITDYQSAIQHINMLAHSDTTITPEDRNKMINSAFTSYANKLKNLFTAIKRFHSGGLITGGFAGGEVPIMAQEGEYVLPRRTVDRVGVGRLESLRKYHSGGLIGSDGLAGMALSPLQGMIPGAAFAGDIMGGILKPILTDVAVQGARAAYRYSKDLFGSGAETPSGKGPFYVFPVPATKGYGDSFGAPRYGGGYHPHAGNDIMADLNAQIFAPFTGQLTNDSNGLGGNAIKLTGSQGYIYGAHLNKFAGSFGKKNVGDLIGYVGNTGDASGGPTHLHFEWHPNTIPAHLWKSPYGYTQIGSAIDPFPFLQAVQGNNPSNGGYNFPPFPLNDPKNPNKGGNKGSKRRYANTLYGWMHQAMDMTGVPDTWYPGLKFIAEHESGGQPHARSFALTPGGYLARGLMQMIPPTYDAYAKAGTKVPSVKGWSDPPGMADIYNPVDNAYSAIKYIKAGYGAPWNTPWLNGGKGYANGGLVKYPQMALIGERGPEAVVPLSQLRFRTPNFINALSKYGVPASTSNTTEGDTHISITVPIEHFHGNDASYRRLYDELQKVARQVARERGVSDATINMRGN